MGDEEHLLTGEPVRESLLRIEILGPVTAPEIVSSMPIRVVRLADEPSDGAVSPEVTLDTADEAALPVIPTAREGDVARRESEVNRREADLDRREQALAGTEALVDTGTADVERRERRVSDLERALQERMCELDEREVAVERRELELESAFAMREDRAEGRENELADLADRLRRKEEDLGRYIGQVQAQLSSR